LATLSDGEEMLVKALKQNWAGVPHQRCQAHFLNNLSEPALSFDCQLRQTLQSDLKNLPAVPHESKRVEATPFFRGTFVCHESRN